MFPGIRSKSERLVGDIGQARSPARRWRALYQRFTLAPDVERVRSGGYVEGSPGYAEFALARASLLDARALASSRDGIGPALILLRASVILFARAHQVR